MAVDFSAIPAPDTDVYKSSNARSGGEEDQPSSPSDVSSHLHDRLLELSEKTGKISDDSWTSSEDHAELNGLLESQDTGIASPHEKPTPSEYLVPVSKKFIYLGLYFCLNVALTLSNKQLLVKISAPWLLTVSHATATSIGCWITSATGHLKLSTLTRREHCILVAFSSLFTLNIAVSNISLALVSVPFHQVLRSTCPVATVILYRFVFQRSYSTETYLSMVPLIAGVGLTTISDYEFTLLGFLLTSLGVFLAATKSIATNRLMTGSLALSPLELLARMSPLAALQCLFYAFMSGELGKLGTFIESGEFGSAMAVAVAGNAMMAFLLNTVSFQTNKLAGALTMSVCGNIKQCLTIILGVLLFDVRLTAINGIGMALAACGAAYYSKVELAYRKPS